MNKPLYAKLVRLLRIAGDLQSFNFQDNDIRFLILTWGNDTMFRSVAGVAQTESDYGCSCTGLTLIFLRARESKSTSFDNRVDEIGLFVATQLVLFHPKIL